MKTSDNIRAMLQSVQDERASLKTRDETLKQREATLIAWLREEAPAPTQADLLANGGTSALGKFLTSTLLPGKRYTASELGEMALKHGVIAEDVEAPGRAVHGALISLQRHGHAKKNDDGTWSKQ